MSQRIFLHKISQREKQTLSARVFYLGTSCELDYCLTEDKCSHKYNERNVIIKGKFSPVINIALYIYLHCILKTQVVTICCVNRF